MLTPAPERSTRDAASPKSAVYPIVVCLSCTTSACCRLADSRHTGSLRPRRTEIMADDVVVLRKYSFEWEAQLAASTLEANGISSHVVADTAGGALPSMALLFPVRLLVLARDADLARELLDTPGDSPTQD